MRFLLFQSPSLSGVDPWPLPSAPATSHLIPSCKKTKQSWTYLTSVPWHMAVSPWTLLLPHWHQGNERMRFLSTVAFGAASSEAYLILPPLVFHLLLTFNLTVPVRPFTWLVRWAPQRQGLCLYSSLVVSVSDLVSGTKTLRKLSSVVA